MSRKKKSITPSEIILSNKALANRPPAPPSLMDAVSPLACILNTVDLICQHKQAMRQLDLYEVQVREQGATWRAGIAARRDVALADIEARKDSHQLLIEQADHQLAAQRHRSEVACQVLERLAQAADAPNAPESATVGFLDALPHLASMMATAGEQGVATFVALSRTTRRQLETAPNLGLLPMPATCDEDEDDDEGEE